MAHVEVASGYYSILRADDAMGTSPYVVVVPETEGAAGMAIDKMGRLWVLRVLDGKMEWCRSTDTLGTAYTAWSTILASGVAICTPAPLFLPTGALIVYYIATDLFCYKATSPDFGATWTHDEVTT